MLPSVWKLSPAPPHPHPSFSARVSYEGCSIWSLTPDSPVFSVDVEVEDGKSPKHTLAGKATFLRRVLELQDWLPSLCRLSCLLRGLTKPPCHEGPARNLGGTLTPQTVSMEPMPGHFSLSSLWRYQLSSPGGFESHSNFQKVLLTSALGSSSVFPL